VSSENHFKRRLRRTWKRVARASRAVPERFLVSLAWHVIPRLSRSWVLLFSRAGGYVYTLLGRRDRKVIEANLDLVFGSATCRLDRRRLVRDICTNVVRMLLDCFWFARNNRTRILEYVSLDPGFEALKKSCDPVVAVTGHMGSWELVAQVLSLHGRRGTSVYAPIGGPATQQLLLKMRAQNGQDLVPREGAVLPLLRALRRGDLVGLLLDQRTPLREGGVFVDFLGRKTTMSKAAGTLSVRLKVPVVTLWCRHVGEGRYLAEVLDFLPPDHGMNETEVTQWVADSLGKAIRHFPEQWLWMYRRWRHVPDGEDPARYPFYSIPHNPDVD